MAGGSIVMFLGSPRKNGYTTALAREVGRGARDGGLAVHEYDLNDPGVRGCQGCYACRDGYQCPIKDYLAPMYADIAVAGGVVVASPIYFYQVTGQAKLWVDRMFPMIDGDFRPRQPGKRAISVFSQYQDDPYAFASAREWFNGILKGFGWTIVASLSCCGEPEEESAAYRGMLRQAYAAGAALAAL